MSDLSTAAATLADIAMHHGYPRLIEAARAVRLALAAQQAAQAPEAAQPVNAQMLEALKRMVESVTGVDQVSAVNEAREAIAAAEAAQAQPKPAFEGEVIVGHSVERGGWCVYEQTAPGEYTAFKGPFPTREEADAAMREPIKVAAQAQPAAVPVHTPITEAMHVAAAKVLTRSHGLDGTPQRMLDAMLAAQPAAAVPAPAVRDVRDVQWCVQWLRAHYQDHLNIASLCEAMQEAAAAPADPLAQQTGEQA